MNTNTTNTINNTVDEVKTLQQLIDDTQALKEQAVSKLAQQLLTGGYVTEQQAIADHMDALMETAQDALEEDFLEMNKDMYGAIYSKAECFDHYGEYLIRDAAKWDTDSYIYGLCDEILKAQNTYSVFYDNNIDDLEAKMEAYSEDDTDENWEALIEALNNIIMYINEANSQYAMNEYVTDCMNEWIADYVDEDLMNEYAREYAEMLLRGEWNITTTQAA